MNTQNIVSGAVGGVAGALLVSSFIRTDGSTSIGLRGPQGTTGPKGENGMFLPVVNSSTGITIGTVPIYDTAITTAYTLKKLVATNVNKAVEGSVVTVGTGPLSTSSYDSGVNQVLFDATKVCGEIGTKPDNGSTSVIIGKKSSTVFGNNHVVSIGNNAGDSGQSQFAIAIGSSAGYSGQGIHGIAIGNIAGAEQQGSYSIAIGQAAGKSGQSGFSISIGVSAGYNNQKNNCVAIGAVAAEDFQAEASVAIGSGAGRSNQGGQTGRAIAIGLNAGETDQPCHSICIGASASHNIIDETGPTAAHRVALSVRCRTNFDETGETGVTAFATTADSFVAIEGGNPVGTSSISNVQSFYDSYIGGTAVDKIGFLNCIFSNNDSRYRAMIPLVHVEKLP